MEKVIGYMVCIKIGFCGYYGKLFLLEFKIKRDVVVIMDGFGLILFD